MCHCLKHRVNATFMSDWMDGRTFRLYNKGRLFLRSGLPLITRLVVRSPIPPFHKSKLYIAYCQHVALYTLNLGLITLNYKLWLTYSIHVCWFSGTFVLLSAKSDIYISVYRFLVVINTKSLTQALFTRSIYRQLPLQLQFSVLSMPACVLE